MKDDQRLYWQENAAILITVDMFPLPKRNCFYFNRQWSISCRTIRDDAKRETFAKEHILKF